MLDKDYEKFELYMSRSELLKFFDATHAFQKDQIEQVLYVFKVTFINSAVEDYGGGGAALMIEPLGLASLAQPVKIRGLPDDYVPLS